MLMVQVSIQVLLVMVSVTVRLAVKMMTENAAFVSIGFAESNRRPFVSIDRLPLHHFWCICEH